MNFQPDGIPHEFGGVFVRVVQGRKADGDLRVEILTAGGWKPVKMGLVAYFAEFFYQNEELLYPRSRGFKGGEKFVEFLQQAVRDGYEQALHILEREKERA